MGIDVILDIKKYLTQINECENEKDAKSIKYLLSKA